MSVTENAKWHTHQSENFNQILKWKSLKIFSGNQYFHVNFVKFKFKFNQVQYCGEICQINLSISVSVVLMQQAGRFRFIIYLYLFIIIYIVFAIKGIF